jgi:hypothetical protein
MLGAFVTIKANMIYESFGTIPIFDKYLSTEGGGRLGYKLIGVLIAFIGILLLTNMLGPFLLWLLSPLFRWAQPPG